MVQDSTNKTKHAQDTLLNKQMDVLNKAFEESKFHFTYVLGLHPIITKHEARMLGSIHALQGKVQLKLLQGGLCQQLREVLRGGATRLL